jgi:hypothetical protein
VSASSIQFGEARTPYGRLSDPRYAAHPLVGVEVIIGDEALVDWETVLVFAGADNPKTGERSRRSRHLMCYQKPDKLDKLIRYRHSPSALSY